MRRRLLVTFGVALAIGIFLPVVVYQGMKPLTIVGFTAALFVMFSSLIDPIQRLRQRQPLSGSVLGMAIAHFGIGLFALGITGVESYRVERDVSLAPGQAITIHGHEFRFLGTRPVTGPNYDAIEADVEVVRDGKVIAHLKPQKRTYWVQQNPMTEADIRVGPGRDLFVALGEDLGAGKWSMRIQDKPLIRYVWFGALIMAIGGIVAVSDRRYRARRRATEDVGAAGAATGSA